MKVVSIKWEVQLGFLIVLLLSTSVYAQKESQENSKISFEGIHTNITYTNNRQIDKAAFTLKNKSKEEVTVKFQAAMLLRGKYQDPLERAAFRVFTKNRWMKVNELVLKPGQTVKLNVTFKPFTIYTGSKYAVMAIVVADGEKYTAVSEFEINKMQVDDKNKYKQGEKK